MDQVDQNISVDDNDDKVSYDKIECHLIGCVSVLCHATQNTLDPKIKNVIIINYIYNV